MTRGDLLMRSIRPLLSADAKPLHRDDECLVAGLTTKMRLKRAVLFAILIVILFSGYYFYTLHFQPRSDIDQIQQQQQQQNQAFFQGQRIAFRVRPKDGDSKALGHDDTGRKGSRGAFPLYPQGMQGVDQARRDRTRGFRLLSKGIATDDAVGAEQELLERTTAWNRGDAGGGGGEQGSEPGDEDLVPPGNAGQLYTLPAASGSGVHRDDDDELSARLKQQQEMIERQEKLLQQLQERVLKENEYKTAPATQFRGLHEPAENAQLQPQGPVTVWKKNTPAVTTRPATADRFQRPSADRNVGANVRVPEDKSAYQANSLLERVESFNGEIKGNFNGVIVKQDDDAANGRMKLAINGIQPMAAPRRRQGGPADQNPPPESPVRDAETGSEQARQRGAAVASNEPSQRLHTPETPAKLQQTAGPRIKTVVNAVTLTEGTGGKNRQSTSESTAPEADDSHGHDSAGNGQHPHDKNDDEGHVVEKVIDVHRVQIPWEPSTQTAAAAAGERTDGARHAAWKGSKDSRHRLVTTRPGSRRHAAAARADLENEVEEVIEERGNDKLLEDRFEEVKNDLENLQPGKEPDVQIGESNKNDNRYAKTDERNRYAKIDNRYAKIDNRYAKTDERGNSRNFFNNNNNNKGPVTAKPEARLKVTVFNLSQPAVGSFQCVPLRLRGLSRTICIYSRDVDTSQSSRLIQRGSWEEKELDEFLAALSTSSSLGAVDLGAGLGEYTLAAASRNRPVLAVEPLPTSIRLFHKTMQLNRVTDMVTLVTDALGEVFGAGRIRHPDPADSMGAAYVEPLKLAEVGRDTEDLVRIVRLDDVLPVMPFSSAVVKLDVQGDEGKVLKGARRFFAQVDVQYVLMHWLPSDSKLRYKESQAFLRQYDLEPAHTVHGTELYTEEELAGDIDFVVWRKRGSKAAL